MNIAAKTNYSALFSNMSTGGPSSAFSFADYASIKNGSYLKAMKSYYAQEADNGNVIGKNQKQTDKVNGKDRYQNPYRNQVKDPLKDRYGMDKKTTAKGASFDTASVNSDISSKASALKKSSEKLMVSGKNNVFAKKDIVTKDKDGKETKRYDYDRDGIHKAVSNFAKDYNDMIDAAKKSKNSSVTSKADEMKQQTLQNEKLLNKVGITIDKDNKLSVDEEKFKKADMGTVKALFNGVNSYAGKVQSKASYMDIYANDDAKKASGLYSAAARYTANLNNGNIFSSYM